jgi:hypothetical protein
MDAPAASLLDLGLTEDGHVSGPCDRANAAVRCLFSAACMAALLLYSASQAGISTFATDTIRETSAVMETQVWTPTPSKTFCIAIVISYSICMLAPGYGVDSSEQTEQVVPEPRQI